MNNTINEEWLLHLIGQISDTALSVSNIKTKEKNKTGQSEGIVILRDEYLTIIEQCNLNSFIKSTKRTVTKTQLNTHGLVCYHVKIKKGSQGVHKSDLLPLLSILKNIYNDLFFTKKMDKRTKLYKWCVSLIQYVPALTMKEAYEWALSRLDYNNEQYKKSQRYGSDFGFKLYKMFAKKVKNKTAVDKIRTAEDARDIVEAHDRHNNTNYDALLHQLRYDEKYNNKKYGNRYEYARHNLKRYTKNMYYVNSVIS